VDNEGAGGKTANSCVRKCGLGREVRGAFGQNGRKTRWRAEATRPFFPRSRPDVLEAVETGGEGRRRLRGPRCSKSAVATTGFIRYGTVTRLADLPKPVFALRPAQQIRGPNGLSQRENERRLGYGEKGKREIPFGTFLSTFEGGFRPHPGGSRGRDPRSRGHGPGSGIREPPRGGRERPDQPIPRWTPPLHSNAKNLPRPRRTTK